ncbi:MAG: hypothetical protein AVDCRST_MAG75-2122 [uncultured Propionibacteriaceae bacterium]|uniref:Uncharacterized protein n=1 Tax=uncultured Propionibacteriaceae bacterium TaxID=257457 RepID=A0A6J4P0V8_9ACTN|nr:MAG: hypothetical protein AVDCRST_MAG75-2122 [uncultured Propionibacteriaceae bacterium]
MSRPAVVPGGPSTLRRWIKARIAAVGGRVDRLVRALRLGSAAWQRPLPRVRIDAGVVLPAWVVRLAMLAVGFGCGLLVVPPTFFAGFVVAVAVLTMVVRPGGAGPAGFVTAAVVMLALGSDGEFAATGLLLLAGLHLLTLLGALVAELSWGALIELRSIWPSARRFLIIQAGVQPLALLGAWLSGQAVTIAVLPVLAGFGVTAFAAWLLPQVASSR